MTEVKKVAKKTSSKGGKKSFKKISKNKVKTSSALIIKKSFDKVPLIVHQITEPTEHSDESNFSYRSVYEISGVGRSNYYKLKKEGITTVDEFIDAGLERISKVFGWSEKGVKPIYLRALSLYQNRVIKIKPLSSVSLNPIYLDIETDPTLSIVWMIGLYFSKTNEFIQLIADKPKDEPKIIKQCFNILSDFPDEQIIHYSPFDKTYLTKRFREENLVSEKMNFKDIYNDLYHSLALPIEKYNLGEVGEFFGYEFRHPYMDGMEVASTYLNYSNGISKYRDFQTLCEYNEDDVKSMFSIVEHLYNKSLDFNKPKNNKRVLFESLTEEQIKNLFNF